MQESAAFSANIKAINEELTKNKSSDKYYKCHTNANKVYEQPVSQKKGNKLVMNRDFYTLL